MNRTLADGVALLHGLLVVYLAGGTLLIAVGLWRRWEFVRNFPFRFSHLLLCLSVNIFEWANLPCPLTTLEWHLREQDSNRASFIQHYVTQAIHVPVPPSMLASGTLPLLLLLIALYKWAGPRPAASPPEASNPRPNIPRGGRL